jgi:hypothetical protein
MRPLLLSSRDSHLNGEDMYSIREHNSAALLRCVRAVAIQHRKIDGEIQLSVSSTAKRCSTPLLHTALTAEKGHVALHTKTDPREVVWFRLCGTLGRLDNRKFSDWEGNLGPDLHAEAKVRRVLWCSVAKAHQTIDNPVTQQMVVSFGFQSASTLPIQVSSSYAPFLPRRQHDVFGAN